MKELFIKEAYPNFEKTATLALSTDSTKWVKEIITYFLEKHPQFQNAGVNIEWKRKDNAKGYGVGLLKIGNASIPIIINDFKLAEMDIVMINNVAYPLTNETLSQMLASPDAFQGVSPSPLGSNLSIFGLVDNSMMNNYGGDTREGTTYSERPAIKLASFIEKISSVKQSDVDKIMNYLDDHPEITSQYHSSGTYEVIEKLAELKTNTAETFAENLLRGIDIDRHMIYEDSRGNTFIKQANSQVDHIWDVSVVSSDVASMEKYATADHPVSAETPRSFSNSYKVVDSDSTLVITEDQDWACFDKYAELSAVPLSEAMDHGLATQTPTIGSYGMFKVGNEVTIPGEIVDISKNDNITPTNAYKVFGRNETLYINDSGEYETKEASSDKVFSTFDLEGAEPMLGETGTFVIGDNAINPFEIVSLQKTASIGNYEIVGYDGLRKISYFPIKMKSQEAIPHETIKSAFYIPGNAKYVKLSGGKMHKDVSTNIEKTANFSPVKMVVKTDSGEISTYFPTESKASTVQPHLYEKNAHYLPENTDFIPLHKKVNVEYAQTFEKVSHFAGKDAAGLYYLSGDAFDKYASNGHEIRNLSKLDALWTAVHCNVSDVEIEKLASLRNGEVIGLRSDVSSPKNTSEIGVAIESKFEKISADIPAINEFLVKEASVLEDKTTVDAVLSLGLLNKENIMDYIQLAPNLEKTSSDLAKTLITVRMGLSHIPEEPVKTAMHSLAKVSRVLRELETIVSDTK